MDPRAWTSSARGRRGVLAVGALVVAFYAWLIRERLYYGNDDLVQFSAAREHGLSTELLGLLVFQHFGPYNRFGHLLVVRYFDLATTPGVVLVSVNFAVLVGCLAWLSRETGLSAGRTSAVLVLVGTSIVVGEVGIFFDAGMHVLPAVAVTMAIVAGHLHAVRTGSTRWHIGTAVLFLLGQLTQERPLFALPVLVLFDVLILWRAHPWRTRLTFLWALRVTLVALTVIAIGVAVALQVFVVDRRGSTPSWATSGRTMLSALVNHVVPALVNQQPEQVLGPSAQFVALGVLLVVGFLLYRASPAANAGPLLLAAASFVLYYAFLKVSPLLTEGSIEFTASRLSNAAYTVVLAIVALAHLEPGSAVDRIRGRLGPARGGRVAAVLAAGVTIFLVHGVVVHLDDRWHSATIAHDYLDRLAGSESTWTDPQVTVLPLAVAPELTTAWAAPLGRHEWFLRLVHPGFDEGDVGPRPVVVDGAGDVHDVRLVHEATFAVGGGACDQGTGLTLGRLAYPMSGDALFLEVTYDADHDVDALVLAGTANEQVGNNWPTHLPAGEHTRLVPVEAGAWDAIALRNGRDTGGLCVERATVVRPVLAPMTPDGACSTIDRYGRVVGAELCPAE